MVGGKQGPADTRWLVTGEGTATEAEAGWKDAHSSICRVWGQGWHEEDTPLGTRDLKEAARRDHLPNRCSQGHPWRSFLTGRQGALQERQERGPRELLSRTLAGDRMRRVTRLSGCRTKKLQPERPSVFGRLYLHDGAGRQDLLFDVGVTG